MLRRKDMKEYIKGCILLCALCLGSVTTQAAEDDDIIEFQCDHLNHVTTQLPYAMTTSAVSFLTFLVVGFTRSALLSLAFGVAVLLAFLLFARYRINKKVS